MQHRDFEAWISSDGARLPVYSTTVLDRITTCYVGAKPGQAFAVHWKDLKGGARIRGTVSVDGERACGALTDGYPGEQVERSEFMVDHTTSRALRFASADTIEEDNLLQDGADRRRQTQVIVVKLSKVTVVGDTGRRCYEGIKKIAARPLVLEEDKALEPLCVSLGPERAVMPHKVVTTRPLDPSDPRYHVVFEFHYCSHTWLEVKGIIPRGPRSLRSTPSQKVEEVQTEMATLRVRLFVVAPEALSMLPSQQRLGELERLLVTKKEEDAAHLSPLKPEPTVLTLPTAGDCIDLTGLTPG